MKLYGLKPGEAHEVTLPLQKDDKPEDRIIFLVTYLSALDAARIQDSLYAVEGWGKNRREEFKTGTMQVEIIKQGLKGWKNFKFEDGNIVDWRDPIGKSAEEREKVMLDNIDKIPPEGRSELADIIRGESASSRE